MANNVVTKSDLIDEIAETLKCTKISAKNQLDTIIGIINNALLEGKDITIGGFGSFKIRQTAERQGRNPQTGEPLLIPAGTKIVFKKSKTSV